MPGIDENVVLWLAVYVGVVVVAFWVAMVIWAYRDMRARSRDTLAQLFVGAVVALLNLPGLFIYIMLRPRETLSEAYERSLEEEALLQEIEEKSTCPGCGQRVQDNWQACPYCHTRLKKLCVSCANMLDLSWDLCPHCATSQRQARVDGDVIPGTGHVQRYEPEPPVEFDEKWLAPGNRGVSRGDVDYPEYIDDDY